MDHFAKKIARNTFFNFLSRVMAFIAAVALSVITARMLGPNRFGSYSLVSATLTVAGLAANLGLSSVAIKYFSEFSGSGGERRREALLAYVIWFKLLATLATIVVLLLLSRPLAAFYRDPDLRVYILVSAAGLLPSGFALLFNNIITGLQEFKNVALRTFIVAPATVILAYAALRLGYGIMGLIVATIVTNFIEFFFYYHILRSKFTFKSGRKLPPDVKSRVLRYNFQVFGIIFLDAIVWQRSEIFFLGKFRPVAEMGFYSLAYGIIEKALLFLPGVLSGVLMPAVSELYGKSEGERIRKLYLHSSKYLLMIALPCAFGLVFLSPQLIRVLFGTAYMPVVPILNILVVSGVFGIVASAGSSVQYGTENQAFILKVGSAIACVNILLDLWLIPRYGAIGAAIANSASQIAGVVIGTTQVCRLLKVSFPFPDLAKITAASLAMWPMVVFCTRRLDGLGGVFSAIAAGGAAYALCLLLMYKTGKMWTLPKGAENDV